jgi:hypothetical protein
MIVTVCIGPTIWLGPGQDIVLIRRIAHPIHRLSLFSERDHLADRISQSRLLNHIAMQPSQIGGDLSSATMSEPRPTPDPITRIHSPGTLCTKIRSPRSLSSTDRRRQRLAMGIGTLKPAKIGPVSKTHAGNEEGHRLRLRLLRDPTTRSHRYERTPHR